MNLTSQQLDARLDTVARSAPITEVSMISASLPMRGGEVRLRFVVG